MALTFEQLSGLIQSSDLAGQIAGAVSTVAEQIQDEEAETPNHANRIKWAKRAFASPHSVGSEMRAAVLTAYQDTLTPSGATLTDTQIKAAIESAVDTFADGS